MTATIRISAHGCSGVLGACYLAGEMYINVHSARYPQGEIRAQLKP